MAFSSMRAAAPASGVGGRASHSSPPPPHDVLLRAYKAEIEQLKDTLHEFAVRDTSSGNNPGFNDVLEGKYLAQIKKNKTLSVQLGTAQQLLSEAQKALQLEQEKTKRLVAATTALATSSKTGSQGAGRGGNNRASRTNAGPSSAKKDNDDDDEDGEDESNEREPLSESASAAVKRVYDQLHQKEIALAEVQRENAALRALIQREVGLRDDTSEVDALIKRTSNATTAAKSTANVATAGWRGRAEEIVLLKSKLKDAQRQVEELAAAAMDQPSDGYASRDDAAGDDANSLALPASVRAYLNMEGRNSSSETRSVTNTTTTTTAAGGAGRRRDVDDDARDRLTAMQQQRAAQQRQSAVDAAKLERQVQEEKMRTAALQARVKTMKSELDTLRTYVDTILDKSATDDELVEMYRAELQQAQKEMREWQRAANTAGNRTGTENRTASELSVPTTLKGVRSGQDMTVAAARSAPYRNNAAPLAQNNENASSEAVPTSAQPLDLQRVDAVVYEWVLRACEEGDEADKGRRPPHETSTANTMAPSATAVAAVLRSALRHVAQVERQATAAAAAAAAALSTADLVGVEAVVLTENAALKKRIRALTDMVEREMQAQKVLWSSREAPA